MLTLIFIALVVAPALVPLAMRPHPVRSKAANRF
jgi:hypothetical protein